MSQSPASVDEFESGSSLESVYRKNLSHVNQLVKRGASFSGHERNCAFLNLNGKSFATISSTSGIDFPDDGRGLATSDWDGDGDLDVWLTSRTSPRIRFLRNELPKGQGFLQLALKGTTCNRDAIGARVSVKLSNVAQPLIKTLRAGEGYLSQSSKIMHFGLGISPSIERVSVVWPSGDRQHFGNLDPNRRYSIVQGDDNARMELELPSRMAIHPSSPSSNPVPRGARVSLVSNIPVPRLPLRVAGSQAPTDVRHVANGRPVLVTLWASWCTQCRQELHDLARHSAQIEQAGLVVLAVNVDGQFDDAPSGDPDALMKSIGWDKVGPSVVAGQATADLVSRLQVLHDLPFGREVTMPVPVSFLIDAAGRLAGMYRGPTAVDTILADTRRTTLDLEQRRTSSLPMTGRFNKQPDDIDLLAIPRHLLDSLETDDALAYVTTNAGRLADSEGFSALRGWLGDQLVHCRRALEGRRQYEAAIKSSPNDVTLLNNLAWLLATHSDAAIRDGQRAVRIAERAARMTDYESAGILDTLAASYAEANEYGMAVQTIKRAVQLSRAAGQSEFADKLEKRQRLYAAGNPHRQ